MDDKEASRKLQELLQSVEIDPASKKRLDAIGKLRLSEIRDLLSATVDPDLTVLQAARCLYEVMSGTKMEEVTAVGLTLIMLSLDCISRDITTVPTHKEEK